MVTVEEHLSSMKRVGLSNRLCGRFSDQQLNKHHVSLVKGLESLQDAFLMQERGSAARRTAALAAKVASSAAATSALLGVATVFGTATTGTAIGTLSGVAWSNAALKWIGGSVAAGSVIVAGVGIVVGVAGYFVSVFFWRKYLSGKPRKLEELTPAEQNLGVAMESVLVGFKGPDDNYRRFPQYAYFMTWTRVLSPTLSKLEALSGSEYAKWPVLSRRRLASSLKRMRLLQNKARGRLSDSYAIPLGQVPVVFLLLMNGQTEFTEAQMLVLEAVRRSTNDLSADASPEEIGEYISSYTGGSFEGLVRNIKGIYHEIGFVKRENADGDEWKAELMAATNHPGADVRLMNSNTGEIVEVQLKATSSLNYIRDHQEKNPDIPVVATDVEARQLDDVESSRRTNSDLESDVRVTADDVQPDTLAEDIFEIAGYGVVAAFTTMTINVGSALISGESIKDQKRHLPDVALSSFTVGAAIAILSEVF